MRFVFVLLLTVSVAAWARNSSQADGSAPAKTPARNASPPADLKPDQRTAPNPPPPRSDRVDASALDDEPGESSSKDEPVDLSPPENDTRLHPNSAEAVRNAEGSPNGSDVGEFHPWDPHKAAKNVEVGDFYFKHKNYIGAESRYREALYYKDNDAVATFRLAVCLDKMNRPDEAREEYENYLKILPYGPEAAEAKKAIERLKNPATK